LLRFGRHERFISTSVVAPVQNAAGERRRHRPVGPINHADWRQELASIAEKRQLKQPTPNQPPPFRTVRRRLRIEVKRAVAVLARSSESRQPA
jgi:hypothetical protein